MAARFSGRSTEIGHRNSQACAVWSVPLRGRCDREEDRRRMEAILGFPPLPIQAVYPQRRYLPLRVRCFVEFLAEQFAANPELL